MICSPVGHCLAVRSRPFRPCNPIGCCRGRHLYSNRRGQGRYVIQNRRASPCGGPTNPTLEPTIRLSGRRLFPDAMT
jgi:hypothetical protein